MCHFPEAAGGEENVQRAGGADRAHPPLSKMLYGGGTLRWWVVYKMSRPLGGSKYAPPLLLALEKCSIEGRLCDGEKQGGGFGLWGGLGGWVLVGGGPWEGGTGLGGG